MDMVRPVGRDVVGNVRGRQFALFGLPVPSWGNALGMVRATLGPLVAAGGILLLLAACSTMVPQTEFNLAQVIHDAEKKAYFIERFRAEFVKTRTMSVFDRDLTVRGRLIFQKPNKFRLTTCGDVTVEILSDGNVVSVIHDLKDQEIRHMQGERDWASFADPLMAILQNLGNGGLRKFSTQETEQVGEGMMFLLRPRGVTSMERIDKAFVTFSPTGVIQKVRIHFKHGDIDETDFRSWSMVTEDDPELLLLEDRLRALRQFPPEHNLGLSSYPTCCAKSMPPIIRLTPSAVAQNKALPALSLVSKPLPVLNEAQLPEYAPNLIH